MKSFTVNEKTLSLKKEINKLINYLNKKFPNNKQTFHIRELLSRNTSKLFEKNDEYKKIYKALLKLEGKEHYYNGDKFKELKKKMKLYQYFSNQKNYLSGLFMIN